MFYIRVILITVTALFMAFHVQIFIYRIEPNLLFSWTAALLIEGFLISLAMSKTIASRILLIPLFLISVIAASASFVVQNEQLLNEFFTQKRVIEQIKTDLSETQKAYQFGERYTTRTLQRERQLRDELRAIMREKEGDVTLINSFIFLLIILVVQSANVYTAMTLKNGKFQRQTAEVSKVSVPEIKSFHEVSTETFPETTETFPETSDEKLKVSAEKDEKVSVVSVTQKHGNKDTETSKSEKLIDEDVKKVIVAALKKRRIEGVKLEHLAETFGVSKSTLSKVLGYPDYPVSDEIFRKISEKL